MDQPETPNQRNPPQKRFFNVNIKFLILFPKNKVFRQKTFLTTWSTQPNKSPPQRILPLKEKISYTYPTKNTSFKKLIFCIKINFLILTRKKSNVHAQRKEFLYVSEENCYTCPKKTNSPNENNLNLRDVIFVNLPADEEFYLAKSEVCRKVLLLASIPEGC